MDAAVVTLPAAAATATEKENLLHSEVKLFNRWSFDGVQVLLSLSLSLSLYLYMSVCICKNLFRYMFRCVDLCSFSNPLIFYVRYFLYYIQFKFINSAKLQCLRCFVSLKRSKLFSSSYSFED